MYNRYIPQPDGTFRRNRLPDAAAAQPPKPRPPIEAAPPDPPHPDPSPRPAPPPRPNASHPGGNSIGSFLRQLLPKGLDTADLFVILLLLLMAGDDPEDRNNALLTMALYLFL